MKEKGVLFWQIAEILRIKNTPFVLLENVDRLLKSPARQRGRDFGIMLRTFHDLGYDVEWRVVNAADMVVLKGEVRVFIFAWRKNLHYCKGIRQKRCKKIFITYLDFLHNRLPIERI